MIEQYIIGIVLSLLITLFYWVCVANMNNISKIFMTLCCFVVFGNWIVVMLGLMFFFIGLDEFIYKDNKVCRWLMNSLYKSKPYRFEGHENLEDSYLKRRYY